MAELTKVQVEAALKQIQDPYIGKDLVASNTIKNIDIEGSKVNVSVELGYPAKGIKDDVAKDIEEKIREAGAEKADVDVIILVTRWSEFIDLSNIVPKSQNAPLVIDGRRMLDKNKFQHYAGIGL